MKAKDLRSRDESDLRKELGERREEVMNLRFQKATGALEDPSRLANVKRDVARILTVLGERSVASVPAGTED